MICKKCGQENIDSASFCSKCGISQVLEEKKIKCKKCGRENKPAAKFCINCGQKLTSQKKAVFIWLISFALGLIVSVIFLPKAMKTTIPLFIIGYTIVFIVGILIPVLLLLQVVKEIYQSKLINNHKALVFNKIIFFVVLSWFVFAIIGLVAAGLANYCRFLQVNSIESCNNSFVCTFRSFSANCVPGEQCAIPLSYPGGDCQAFFMKYDFLAVVFTIILVYSLFLPVFIFPILLIYYSLKKNNKKT